MYNSKGAGTFPWDFLRGKICAQGQQVSTPGAGPWAGPEEAGSTGGWALQGVGPVQAGAQGLWSSPPKASQRRGTRWLKSPLDITRTTSPGRRLWQQARQELHRCRESKRASWPWRLEVRHQLLGGKLFLRLHLPQVRRLPHQDQVGVLKGLGVGLLKDFAPGGVGAGLEGRHQAPRPGRPWRTAARVTPTAVGWWAKSSRTSTPSNSPATSWRFLNPFKSGQGLLQGPGLGPHLGKAPPGRPGRSRRCAPPPWAGKSRPTGRPPCRTVNCMPPGGGGDGRGLPGNRHR